ARGGAGAPTRPCRPGPGRSTGRSRRPGPAWPRLPGRPPRPRPERRVTRAAARGRLIPARTRHTVCAALPCPGAREAPMRPDSRDDRLLGLDQDITRRDFLNAALVGAGGVVLRP